MPPSTAATNEPPAPSASLACRLGGLAAAFFLGLLLQFLVSVVAVSWSACHGAAQLARPSARVHWVAWAWRSRPCSPADHPQGCALWHNWWPMLTAFVYVLVSSGCSCCLRIRCSHAMTCDGKHPEQRRAAPFPVSPVLPLPAGAHALPVFQWRRRRQQPGQRLAGCGQVPGRLLSSHGGRWHAAWPHSASWPRQSWPAAEGSRRTNKLRTAAFFNALAPQAVAIPAILFHAQKITAGALMMELAAMAVLGGTVLAWQFFSENEGSSPFVY